MCVFMYMHVCVSPPAPFAAEPARVPGTVHGGKVSCLQTGGQDPRAGDQVGVREDTDQTLRGEIILCLPNVMDVLCDPIIVNLKFLFLFIFIGE